MRQMATWHKKSFREWMLNLCGYEIWPPTHNDPTIKGPQPRIISKRQRKAMEKMWRENTSMSTTDASTLTKKLQGSNERTKE